MATILCSIIEYVHYSRAIEEKKYCVVLCAIEVHDSLTHCISSFSCMTRHLDARCPAFHGGIWYDFVKWRHIDVPRVGNRMNKAHVLNERVKEYICPACRQQVEHRFIVVLRRLGLACFFLLQV